MASSPFAMEWPQEARETRQECVGILTAAAEKKRAGSAIAAHNYQDGNYIEQIVGQEEVGAANSARQGEIEGGLESRMQVDINALVPLPAPLRTVRRGQVIEAPVSKFPRPLSWEQRSRYAVHF
jgi:hypothetical protein